METGLPDTAVGGAGGVADGEVAARVPAPVTAADGGAHHHAGAVGELDTGQAAGGVGGDLGAGPGERAQVDGGEGVGRFVGGHVRRQRRPVFGEGGGGEAGELGAGGGGAGVVDV